MPGSKFGFVQLDLFMCFNGICVLGTFLVYFKYRLADYCFFRRRLIFYFITYQLKTLHDHDEKSVSQVQANKEIEME